MLNRICPPRLTIPLCTAVGTLGLLHSAGANRICLDAANPTSLVPPMQIVELGSIVRDASANRALALPRGVGSPPEVGGSATFVFNVPSAGRYRLWARAWWEDGCGNSVTMRIDDHAEFTFGQGSTHGTWHWMQAPPRLRQLELSEGKHTLTISNREDGVALDQILLIKSSRYVPMGIEELTPELQLSGPTRQAAPDLPWRVAGR